MGQVIQPKPKTTISGKPMKHRRRIELWLADPCCHWCGTLTVLYVPGYGERSPDNMATLDHIHSRLDPERREVKDTVLACLKCNWTRGKEREMLLSPGERAARTQTGEERRRQKLAKKFTNSPHWKVLPRK